MPYNGGIASTAPLIRQLVGLEQRAGSKTAPPDDGDAINQVVVPGRVKEHLKQMRSQIASLQELMSRLESEYVNETQPIADQSKEDDHKDSTFDRSPSMLSNGGGTKSERLFDALVNGEEHEVLDKLGDSGCDPNTLFQNFLIRGKSFVSGRPLAIATLMGRVSLVKPLIDSKADPNLVYSFRAGGEHILWSGPPIHAAVPSGNLELLKELAKNKADLHQCGSNGANLVWQAAYFGQNGVLNFLLEANVDFNVRAASQDDSSLSYTPLHSAAKAGHLAVVNTLLGVKADIHVDDGCGRHPLEDAAAKGSAEVVRQLVVANADLFRNVNERIRVGRATSLENDPEPVQRSLDMIFGSENSHLVAAVAQGLARAPKLLDKLCKDDLIHFLQAHGEAAMHILGAIFQPHPVRFWAEGPDGRLKRMLQTVSFVNAKEGVNIELGPHSRLVDKFFFDKVPPPRTVQSFLTRLVPWQKGPEHMMYVPVAPHMCHIPFLHQELEVLLAIADCQDSRVFGVKGCQAIINMKWQAERLGSQARMVMAFVEVLNLVLLNVILNHEHMANRRFLLTFANILALLVWIVAVFMEVSQAVGYIINKLHRRYLTSLRYWFDWIVSITTGVVIWLTALLGDQAHSNPVYNTLLGVLVFLKWMRLLISLRQLKTIGLRILPITTTMWDVGPFVGVLSVYIVGSVNMYYALGINDISESFFLIYRIVVLGDVDLYELEGVFNPAMRIGSDGYSIMQSEPERTQYYVVVRIMMVVVSFVMGLSMMNLFVAMLCLSYSMAAENAWYSFMRSRAGIVLDQHAMKLGMRSLLSLLCCCCRYARRRHVRAKHVGRHSPQARFNNKKSTSANLDDGSEEAMHAFIWYACQEEPSHPKS